MALCNAPIARRSHQASCKRITPASPMYSRQIGHGSFFCTNSSAQRVQHTKLIPPFRELNTHVPYHGSHQLLLQLAQPSNKQSIIYDMFIFTFFQKGEFNVATIDEDSSHRQIVTNLAFTAHFQSVHVTRLHIIHLHFRSAPGSAPEQIAELTYHNLTISCISKAT